MPTTTSNAVQVPLRSSITTLVEPMVLPSRKISVGREQQHVDVGNAGARVERGRLHALFLLALGGLGWPCRTRVLRIAEQDPRHRRDWAHAPSTCPPGCAPRGAMSTRVQSPVSKAEPRRSRLVRASLPARRAGLSPRPAKPASARPRLAPCRARRQRWRIARRGIGVSPECCQAGGCGRLRQKHSLTLFRPRMTSTQLRAARPAQRPPPAASGARGARRTLRADRGGRLGRLGLRARLGRAARTWWRPRLRLRIRIGLVAQHQ